MIRPGSALQIKKKYLNPAIGKAMASGLSAMPIEGEAVINRKAIIKRIRVIFE